MWPKDDSRLKWEDRIKNDTGEIKPGEHQKEKTRQIHIIF